MQNCEDLLHYWCVILRTCPDLLSLDDSRMTNDLEYWEVCPLSFKTRLSVNHCYANFISTLIYDLLAKYSALSATERN